MQRKDVVLVVAGHRHSPRRRCHASGNHVEFVTLVEEGFVARVELEERGHNRRRVTASCHLLEQLAIRLCSLQLSLQRLAEHLGAVGQLDDS